MPKKIIKNGKETTVFDVTSEEDMEIAEKLAKAQLVANEGGQSKEDFEKQAEREEIEGRKLFEGMKKKAQEMYEEKGLNAPKIDNEEALTQAIENISRIEAFEQKSEGGSGSAPLNRAQITGGMPQKEGFESYEAMIDHLRDLEKVGNAQERKYAKEVIQRLTYNSLKKLKQEGKPVVYEDKDFEILKKITENKRRRELMKRGFENEQ